MNFAVVRDGSQRIDKVDRNRGEICHQDLRQRKEVDALLESLFGGGWSLIGCDEVAFDHSQELFDSGSTKLRDSLNALQETGKLRFQLEEKAYTLSRYDAVR